MLNIIGVGSAYPDTVIHNEDLARFRKASAFSEIFPGAKGKARRTSLPLSYIEETGNGDTFKIPEVALMTPTALGVKAVQDALKCVGIQAEQLGLILGDSSTPHETCPGEGQRITGGLGIKGISYDLSAGSCTLSAHLSSISKWQDERIPDYVLSVSTNTTTQNIDFRSGDEAAYFGDAASAVIISSRIPGKLKVHAASYSTYPMLPDFLVVDLYGYLKIGEKPSLDLVEPWIETMLGDLGAKLSAKDEIKFILPPLFEDDIAKILCTKGFEARNNWSNAEFLGDSLGSYSASVLAGHWSEINQHSQVLIVEIGAGVGFGYLFLSV